MSKSKLRIAVVVGSFPTVSETFIVNQLNALKVLGHEVSLFAYHRGPMEHLHPSITLNAWDKKVQYPPKGATTFKNRSSLLAKLIVSHPLRMNWSAFFTSVNPLRYGKRALSLRMFFKAYWFIKNKPFDVVQVHFGPNAEKVGHLKALGFLQKEKLVATFHGFDMVENGTSAYAKQYQHIWKYFDAVTVNTPYLEGILKTVQAKLPPISILPMGLDTDYFKPIISQKSQNPFVLLFCGRLISLKGPDLAIEAVALLKQKGIADVQLRIIGEGPMAVELAELAKSIGVEEEARLLGAMDQAAVRDQMDKAHIFLLPGRPDPETGRAETQGLVIQEAQAMGLPVIASNLGGMPYGVLEGKTGYLHSCEDVESITNHIITLKSTPDLYESFSKKARKHVVKNYDYRILGQQWNALFLELLTR